MLNHFNDVASMIQGCLTVRVFTVPAVPRPVSALLP